MHIGDLQSFFGERGGDGVGWGGRWSIWQCRSPKNKKKKKESLSNMGPITSPVNNLELCFWLEEYFIDVVPHSSWSLCSELIQCLRICQCEPAFFQRLSSALAAAFSRKQPWERYLLSVTQKWIFQEVATAVKTPLRSEEECYVTVMWGLFFY